MSQKIYLTKQGLKRLQEEYRDLVDTQRPQLVQRISRAREMGDLSENSDYHDARDRLRFFDDRIADLQKALAKVVVIQKPKNLHKIGLGCRVSVSVNGRKQVFEIVGELEADPVRRKISSQSPLGKAFMGKKMGDKVEVNAPGGKVVYRVKKIE